MVNLILKPCLYIFFRVALRCFHFFENNIQAYTHKISSSLGFEYVSKLLLFISNPEAIANVLLYHGASIGEHCRINSPLMVQNALGSYANFTVGNNCHIGKDVMLDLANRITIGDNVTISMRCSIITHFDVGDSNLRFKGFSRKDGDVVIKNNVYFGCGVTVLHGVTIGENSLIGAGALVTTDIPANSIAVGSPAKVIREIDGNIKS